MEQTLIILINILNLSANLTGIMLSLDKKRPLYFTLPLICVFTVIVILLSTTVDFFRNQYVVVLSFLPLIIFLFKGMLFHKVFAFFMQLTIVSSIIFTVTSLTEFFIPSNNYLYYLWVLIFAFVMYCLYILLIWRFGKKLLKKLYQHGSRLEWAWYSISAALSYFILNTAMHLSADYHLFSYAIAFFILWNFIILCFAIINTNEKARHRYEAALAQSTIKDLEEKVGEVYYDPLTRVYNRRYLDENLSSLLKALSRSNGILSFMMIDIDRFKQYNDMYGHNEGDKCLKIIAQTLSKNIVRESDFFVRYGGEEFSVALPNTDEAGARTVAEKLLECVRSLNIPHCKSDIAPFVTVSIGITTGKVEHGQTNEDFIKRADELLYASKQNGRDRYTYGAFDGKSE